MNTATLIYRNVFCGGGGTAFHCSNCEVHVVIGICPRFCPACGVKFIEWYDAGIDLSIKPIQRWDNNTPKKLMDSGDGCNLANPPR